MSSSTSSSEPRGEAVTSAPKVDRSVEPLRASVRQEWTALLVAALVLLGVEAHARWRAAHPIYDYARLVEIPAELARGAAPATQPSDGPLVMLVGNSLTRNGYDLPLLTREMQAANPDQPVPRVVNAALFGSVQNEWYYLFKHLALDHGNKPAVLVMNLSPGVAQDRGPLELRTSWLAAETNWSDLPELIRGDFRSFSVTAEYVQARASQSFAQRWDLRTAILFHTVPNYLAGSRWVNGRHNSVKDAKANRPDAPKPTYRTLQRTLDLATANNVKVIVLALPVREMYPIDPNLITTVTAAGHDFMDCRDGTGLTPDQFEPDGWHMLPVGAQTFSRYLAKRLPARVAGLLSVAPSR